MTPDLCPMHPGSGSAWDPDLLASRSLPKCQAGSGAPHMCIGAGEFWALRHMTSLPPLGAHCPWKACASPWVVVGLNVQPMSRPCFLGLWGHRSHVTSLTTCDLHLPNPREMRLHWGHCSILRPSGPTVQPTLRPFLSCSGSLPWSPLLLSPGGTFKPRDHSNPTSRNTATRVPYTAPRPCVPNAPGRSWQA